MAAYPFKTFTQDEILAFEPAMKIGVMATVSDNGLPHLTMISTLKASSEKEVVWGQFMEGRSKAYIRNHPQVGWLIMTLDKNLWHGKACFTHTEKSGKDFDFYNNIPLFRYNSYFGVHTVYYMDLVEQTGKQALPMNAVVFSAVKTMFARTLSPSRAKINVFNPWTQRFLNKLDNLKFLSYVGKDEFPVIIPAIQAQAGDLEHVLFSTSVYRADLEAIPAGAPLAVLSLALTMEDVLVRGKFEGIRRFAGVRCGSVKVDWVYNSMPPVPGQVYPEVELEAVKEF
ncbi:MAG TPA: pyridoxamine 5'-phosphate oxidase family protein [Anaerolineaceae bacterium]